jgi:glycosyltransferase involved in cell wall biosynthesis
MPPLLSQTLIVLPALNEELSVGNVVREVLIALPSVTCLVIDDGSRDNTGNVARLAGARVATLPFNLGVGGAMSVGFKYALANGFHNVVQIDADGQHNPSNVPSLLAGLENADLVIGARFAGTGNYNVGGPRRWTMWFLAKTLSRLTRTALTDTTSGFKANGPRAVALFAEYFPAEYLGDTVEALVIASRAGCVIRQVPVSMRERQAGTPSQHPVRAGLHLARALMALVVALLRPQTKKFGVTP